MSREGDASVVGAHVRRLRPGALTAYLASLFMLRFAAVLLILVALLQVLNTLSKSDAILAAEGADWKSVLEYSLLSAAVFASRFAPFAALLATLLTLAGLSQSSEITVIRAAGLSAGRILRPLILACGAIAGFHFAFHQLVVTPTIAYLRHWEANDFERSPPPDEDRLENVWAADERFVVKAALAAWDGDEFVLTGVTIYERDEEGLLASRIIADQARRRGDAWTLYEGERFDALTARTERFDELPWAADMTPDLFFLRTLDPEAMSLGALYRLISRLRPQGEDTSELETEFWQRFAVPAASLLMPLMGAVAGFGTPRRGSLFARIAIGLALGFGFFVADNFMAAMGKLGATPPIFAAFSPFFVFFTAGVVALFIEEENLIAEAKRKLAIYRERLR
ncbi:MAG: hypothetical protein Tsb0010_11730 [Parvularculaceae bacterium]